jgi:aldehyde:ferredoxin oxidoreductase
VKNYLGGAGFAIKYLYDELKPSVPALGKDNKLVFAVGPLTATGAPCASRMAVAAKLKELGIKEKNSLVPSLRKRGER